MKQRIDIRKCNIDVVAYRLFENYCEDMSLEEEVREYLHYNYKYVSEKIIQTILTCLLCIYQVKGLIKEGVLND